MKRSILTWLCVPVVAIGMVAFGAVRSAHATAELIVAELAPNVVVVDCLDQAACDKSPAPGIVTVDGGVFGDLASSNVTGTKIAGPGFVFFDLAATWTTNATGPSVTMIAEFSDNGFSNVGSPFSVTSTVVGNILFADVAAEQLVNNDFPNGVKFASGCGPGVQGPFSNTSFPSTGFSDTQATTCSGNGINGRFALTEVAAAIISTGFITFDGSTFGPFSGLVSLDNASFLLGEPVLVPEPSLLLALGAGLGGVALWGRKRRTSGETAS